ncbi:hypothetical protein ACCC88_04370 [Sphingomonas sp. Sphisp140]|uniref:hypothetical protein n=1 Tax=unclassified Sphingomonas TaxID=196159 RepID=UPI0039AF7137
MSGIDREALVAEAMLAPSVHNVQPARWRLAGADGLQLFEDPGCRLTVGDPSGNDAGISLGAAAEGLRLAASRVGLALVPEGLPATEPRLRPVAGYRLAPSEEAPDPLAGYAEARRSWRGTFAKPGAADREAASALVGEDAAVLTDPEVLTGLARRFDRASFGFMRESDFRGELLSWMRLTPRHPRWSRDGLNAEAMAMGRVEAWGAGLLLGRGFAAFDRIGLARPLLAEGAKVAAAAGLVVFHRPVEEAPFDSGAHFYRLWLRLEAVDFGAAVLAALADDREAAAEVARIAGVPDGHRVVSAFRIGRRPAGAMPGRARRSIGEVLV